MSERNFQQVRMIIKNECCNYDGPTGGCLLLDDGEVVHCPQLLTRSLTCRWFRDAILEAKEHRELKAEIMGEDHVRVCEICGEHFRALSNRAKYCARCGKKSGTGRQRPECKNTGDDVTH